MGMVGQEGAGRMEFGCGAVAERVCGTGVAGGGGAVELAGIPCEACYAVHLAHTPLAAPAADFWAVSARGAQQIALRKLGRGETDDMCDSIEGVPHPQPLSTTPHQHIPWGCIRHDPCMCRVCAVQIF